jgi:hypothetical protein
MGFRTYVVTDEAVVAARRAGIVEDTRATVVHMARRSAPYDHPRGNKRFRKYILMIEGGAVIDVVHADGVMV